MDEVDIDFFSNLNVKYPNYVQNFAKFYGTKKEKQLNRKRHRN